MLEIDFHFDGFAARVITPDRVLSYISQFAPFAYAMLIIFVLNFFAIKE